VAKALGLAPAGGSYRTIKRYIIAWGLDVSHFTGQAWVGTRPGPTPGQRYTLEEIFREGSTYPTGHLLKIILREGYRERRCESCGLTEWLGQPIAIEVDHANGVNNDHRLENLRLLCPNCHALTPTWRGRANRRLQVA
jgi:Zn finger protein HypA/HybF involved in hydrogenase expression